MNAFDIDYIALNCTQFFPRLSGAKRYTEVRVAVLDQSFNHIHCSEVGSKPNAHCLLGQILYLGIYSRVFRL
jgi:hypothetical protein